MSKLALIPGLKVIAEVAKGRLDIANMQKEEDIDDYMRGYLDAQQQIVDLYESVLREVRKNSIN